MALVLLLAYFGLSLAATTCNYSYNVTMSDGVVLTTFVRVPTPCTNKYPVTYDRTPYGTTGGGSAASYNADGFASVEQNQRGCSGSGGTYDFWKMDSKDGYDTMKWIAQQNWSNGQVFTVGTSADACSLFTDMMTPAVSQYLHGQFPTVGTAFGHETSYWRGAYRTGLIKNWLYLLTSTCPGAVQTEKQVETNEPYNTWWAPLEAQGPYGNYFPNVKWPSVQYAGWWDIFQQQNIDAYNGYATQSDATVRDKQWLFVQPLGHCDGSNSDFGFPQNDIADAGAAGLAMFQNNFTAAVFSRVKKINVYVFGTVPKYVAAGTNITGNYWSSFDTWPTTTNTKYYLGTSGDLTTTLPTTNTSQTYVYDPSNPVQSNGGNNLFQTCGPRDQTKAVDSRSDVLKFTQTTTLSAPLAFCGHITANLFVSTDQVDTDFVVSLDDIYPDGQSIQIRYGAVRMRWNANAQNVTLLTPGQVYTANVDLWSTCTIVNAGHKLRVTVTSSSTPSYTVNPNNGRSLVDGGPLIVAKNTVYLGGTRASYITLPVVPVSALAKNTLIR
jgi:hypothetical protein